MNGKMKERARITSKRLSLEAGSGMGWEEKQLVSDADHPEKGRPHSEE